MMLGYLFGNPVYGSTVLITVGTKSACSATNHLVVEEGRKVTKIQFFPRSCFFQGRDCILNRKKLIYWLVLSDLLEEL